MDIEIEMQVEVCGKKEFINDLKEWLEPGRTNEEIIVRFVQTIETNRHEITAEICRQLSSKIPDKIEQHTQQTDDEENDTNN